MNTISLYGIPNCDTTKKALAWYKKNNIRVDFHDYKAAGLKKEKLQHWCNVVRWEVLLNKKSTTWRALPPEVQEKVTTEKAAISLMLQYPTLIKRPVVEMNDKVMVGFKEQ